MTTIEKIEKKLIEYEEALLDHDGNMKLMAQQIAIIETNIKSIRDELAELKKSVDFIESFDEDKLEGETK